MPERCHTVLRQLFGQGQASADPLNQVSWRRGHLDASVSDPTVGVWRRSTYKSKKEATNGNGLSNSLNGSGPEKLAGKAQ